MPSSVILLKRFDRHFHLTCPDLKWQIYVKCGLLLILVTITAIRANAFYVAGIADLT